MGNTYVFAFIFIQIDKKLKKRLPVKKGDEAGRSGVRDFFTVSFLYTFVF